jgi:hypothetical protein
LAGASIANAGGADAATSLQTGLKAAAVASQVTSDNGGQDATTAGLTAMAQAANGQATNPIQQTANEQIAAIRAIGDANAVAKQQAEQRRLATQQSSQQTAANQNSSSNRQSGGAGGADSSAPGTGGRGGKSCVNATPEKGRWKLSNCAGEYENVAFTQPNAVTNGAVASGWHEDFSFFGGESYLTSADSRYSYKIWACTGGSVPIDTATGTVPTYYSPNVECK